MEVLEEENPLDTYNTRNNFDVVCNNSKINCAGRPPNSKSIKFSEQPKSIISQMLLLEQQVISDTSLESGDHTIQENNLSNEDRPMNTICKNDINKGVKLYTCSYADCSYTTKISSNLTKHKRTHSHQKLYLCDECTFSTKFSNSLNVHKRLHSNKKPFYCQYCEYRCNSSSNLKKHRNHRHSDKLNVPKILQY